MIKELYQPVEPQSRRPSYMSSSSMASTSSSVNNGFQHRHQQKAVVFSAEKWNQLLATASGTPPIRPQTALVLTDDGKTLAQKEAEYKQYLKKESQAMTRKWENTVQNIREKKEAEQLRKQREKVEEGEFFSFLL